MGSNMAIELAQGVFMDDRNSQIAMHLTSNHYPPVPTIMVQACIEAIEACNELCFQRRIELPEGCSWRGESSAPASAIVEGHHLEAWLDELDY